MLARFDAPIGIRSESPLGQLRRIVSEVIGPQATFGFTFTEIHRRMASHQRPCRVGGGIASMYSELDRLRSTRRFTARDVAANLDE